MGRRECNRLFSSTIASGTLVRRFPTVHRIVSDKGTIRTSPTDYDDNYATCAETYATVRIYTGKNAPELVTAALRLTPSRLLNQESDTRPNGWLLSSKGAIDSLDVRRHVDWLLERIVDKRAELSSLQSEPGVWMDVFCYWRSTQGHGGPALSPKQMKTLADLNLTIGFDCY
jgi:hypothetical protein